MIFLEGNIAAGKSTLGAALAAESEVVFWEEPVAAWRSSGILGNYYADQARWAFTMQIAALTARAGILRKAVKTERGILGGTRRLLLERSMLTDKHVFAEYSVLDGNMGRIEAEIYQEAWKQTEVLLPAQPVIVYLRTPAAVCLDRVHSRGRAEEQGMRLDYLTSLEALHENWLMRRDPAITAVVSGAQTVRREVEAFKAWRRKNGV